MIYKTLTGSIDRPFVKYPNGESTGRIEIHREDHILKPFVSIIIPTADATRDGLLPSLFEQLKQQTFQDFEIIVIIGDTRQGRAINCGAQVAEGKYIVTFDDDTKLGHADLLEIMVNQIEQHSDIGMAGVANLVPENASFFVKRVMKELPRRTSPMVDKIIDSDMAEHPCCIIPRKIFLEVGGENEIIPRGLDPYLRQEIRNTGYRVVVLPNVYIHHLPPKTFRKFVKQFYRNGKMAAYVNKFYPEFVIELTTQHGDEVSEKRSLITRIFSYIGRLLKTFLTLRLFYLLSLVLYLTGYVIGYITLKESDV
ncbi:glycosyltransferase [bacterium]|nr:glycosyltransferase [bacterium]MBU1064730.1 glycosyltransferase [bacterium]MBU1633907.1 glycosyltransferase [bacterium]MBU1872462.1 glycosyltransferase [bacterium]